MLLVDCAFSLEPAQSTHAQLDLGGAASTALIPTDFTATHADMATHIDSTCSSGRTGRVVQTPSLIVMPNTAPSLPYHAVAASLLPATVTNSLLGYVDLVTHQTGSCVSPPPSLFASQRCLTTKIHGGRNLPLVSTKFTPY